MCTTQLLFWGNLLSSFFSDIAVYLVTAIFIFISFGPLARLTMQSSLPHFALTESCSGNCAVDGCSLASQQNYSCCCWQNKQLSHPSITTAGCCLKDDQKKIQPRSQNIAKDKLVYKCGNSCGQKEYPLPAGFSIDKILPFYFIVETVFPQTTIQPFRTAITLLSRPQEPPEPPPDEIDLFS